MRIIAGERDNLIMNTVPRFQPANDRVLLLAATAQSFKVPATGVASPAAITFTAALLNMVGVVDISTSDGSVLELDGNAATLRYPAMASNTTTITARIVADGLTYTASQTVSKIFDGVTGNSSRVCYSKTSLVSLASTPATISTEGGASFPPLNTWGAGTVWEGSPQEFAAGESLYRSDGIFNPASGTTKWSAPYLNALKVGRLSAISADIGEITAGTLRAVTIYGGPGYLTKEYAWPTNGQGGFHLSAAGLLMGCYSTGKYFNATADGNLYMPGMKIENGQATFSGLLNGARGLFSGNVVTGTASGFRVEMGPDDPIYVLWAGSGVKNDVNAIFYLKRDGSGYFGGSLSAGTLKTAVSNPAFDPNAQVIDGPFGSNGGTINVVCSLDWGYYQSSRRHDYSLGSGSLGASLYLYRKIGSGDEELVQSLSLSGSVEIENYSDPDQQSTCTQTIAGSLTYTDMAATTQNRTYRAVVAITQQNIIMTRRRGSDDGGGFPDGFGQRLTLITTE